MAKVAVLIADGFNEAELSVPTRRLADEGHLFVLLGTEHDLEVTSDDGRLTLRTEAGVTNHRVDEFDALLIPGGRSPQALREHPAVLAWLEGFCRMGRPVGAIGTAPRLLIAAGQAFDRRITAAPELQDQLRAEGADLVDQPVVSDGAFTTARGADDMEAFCRAWLRPVHRRQEVDHRPLQG